MCNTHFIFLEETASTNAEMRKLLNANKLTFNNVKDVFLLHTNYQIGGKGLGNNGWESDYQKNLLVTFALKYAFPADKQFKINQFFALAVRKFLSHYLENVQIKWSNDLYVQNRKIGGILIEHFIRNQTICNTILGVGININQTYFSEAIPRPTSLKSLTGKDYDLISLLNLLNSCFREYYNIFQQKDFSMIENEYLQNLYHFEMWYNYKILQNVVEARIIGLDNFGRLRLEERNGKVITCGFKEVEFMF